jgi:surfeit locus 1 family protein
MLRRFRQAGLIWPTVAAVGALAVLIGLGTWQLERKRWKEALLATIAARVDAEPVALAAAIERLRGGENVAYLHVSASGRFRHDKERFLYMPARSGLGWHVYAPLEFKPGRIVWVNRGFVPDARKDPAQRAAGQVAGEQEVRGIVRMPAGRPRFAPDNNSDANVWYWPDVPAMTASAFGDAAMDALPFVIVADARPEPPGGLPRGGVTRIALPNRHLEYALTWCGIALTLIGVYLAFVINRLRGQEGA